MQESCSKSAVISSTDNRYPTVNRQCIWHEQTYASASLTCFSNSFTILRSPRFVARCSGVWPSLLCTSTPASRSSNSCAASRLLLYDARCSGVERSLACASISAPYSTSVAIPFSRYDSIPTPNVTRSGPCCSGRKDLPDSRATASRPRGHQDLMPDVVESNGCHPARPHRHRAEVITVSHRSDYRLMLGEVVSGPCRPRHGHLPRNRAVDSRNPNPCTHALRKRSHWHVDPGDCSE